MRLASRSISAAVCSIVSSGACVGSWASDWILGRFAEYMRIRDAEDLAQLVPAAAGPGRADDPSLQQTTTAVPEERTAERAEPATAQEPARLRLTRRAPNSLAYRPSQKPTARKAAPTDAMLRTCAGAESAAQPPGIRAGLLPTAASFTGLMGLIDWSAESHRYRRRPSIGSHLAARRRQMGSPP